MIRSGLERIRAASHAALIALDRWESRHVRNCPCCAGTAGLPRFGPHGECSLCVRSPWHDTCRQCWDHCRCQPHPLARALRLTGFEEGAT